MIMTLLPTMRGSTSPGVLPLVPIATRYDKRARNFLAAIHLAAAVIWLN